MSMNQASITVPYAVADFADLRERGFYYVDKTNHIALLEQYNAPVFLRPRRFGKSLFVSTLAHYYDRSKAHRFKELFGDTYIGQHPTPEQGRYLVIRYDFSKMVMSNTIEGLEQNFNDLNCRPVEIMVEHNRDIFGEFQFTTQGHATKMLEEALSYVVLHGLPKVYILIDEYDNFTNQLLTGYKDPLYECVTTGESFLRCSFYEMLSRYLSQCYTFAVEQNLPSGRADLVLTGIPGTAFHNDCRVVEFKYFKAKDAAVVEALEAVRPEDAKQVKNYAQDINRQFPSYQTHAYVVYLAAGKVCKVWEV